MQFHLWTVQMAQWRLCKKEGIFLLDTTAKSGEQAFAPEYGAVIAYKNGALSENDYTKAYLEKMALSLEMRPDKWRKLLLQPKVAIACYCRAGVFCHRHLFLDLMEGYLQAHNQHVTVHGELTPQGRINHEPRPEGNRDQ